MDAESVVGALEAEVVCSGDDDEAARRRCDASSTESRVMSRERPSTGDCAAEEASEAEASDCRCQRLLWLRA